MKSAYRGTLIGVLVGDAIGARFEGSNRVNPHILVEHIKGLLDTQGSGGKPQSSSSSPVQKSVSEKTLRYTDDTSMTRSTCKSLLANKGFNAVEMAKEYTETFFQEPNRGYGASVHTSKLIKYHQSLLLCN